MTTWYLLRDLKPRPGAENMAVDRHLLELTEQGLVDAPVLRLYAWSTPTLSLGYHQQWRRTVDKEALTRHGVDLVRRWTGGRGVLHDFDEITYAVIAKMAAPFSTRLKQNYRLIGEALEDFTRLDTSPATLVRDGERPEEVRRNRHLPCFASLGESEIEKGGRKLIGSSQKLGRNAFLQHGSIPLVHRTRVLEEITGTQVQMEGYMTSLEEHYAAADLPLPPRAALLDRLSTCFARRFGISFRPISELGYPDEAEVARITDACFGQDEWTFRK